MILLLALACGPSEPPAPIDPLAAAARVDEALVEAARLDAEARNDEAVIEWARGVHRFEHELEPWLRDHAPATEVVRIEYRFALMRREMGRSKGKPASELELLRSELAPWLPDAQDGAVLAEEPG